MHDTTKDFRLAITEKTAAKIQGFVRDRIYPFQYNRSGVLEDFKLLNGKLQLIKYSYLDEAALKDSKEIKEVILLAEKILTELTPEKKIPNLSKSQKIAVEFISFFKSIFSNLKESFSKENSPQAILSLYTGEILSVSSHPNADKLVICKVDLGDQRVDVITNMMNVKVGMRMPLAIVPPIDLRGIVSGVQFIDSACDGEIGPAEMISEHGKKEIVNAIKNLI